MRSRSENETELALTKEPSKNKKIYFEGEVSFFLTHPLMGDPFCPNN